MLNKTEDILNKIQELLRLIQNKGDAACCQFLEHLEIMCPGSNLHLRSSLDDSSHEQEDETEEEPKETKKWPEQKPKKEEERRKRLDDILCKLRLWRDKKLTLQGILEISPGSLKEFVPRTLGSLPWHFLRKVLALNVTARNTTLEQKGFGYSATRQAKWGETAEQSFPCIRRKDENNSVDPLDLICAVLLRSDSFLQQEILLKMSMCQFALPLLLPPLETPKGTLMLWAMRDIVKKWRPHSLADSKDFKEESLALISMPTIAFVRMGNSHLSKSQILNSLLSRPQQHHDFFVHRDMLSGKVSREIADGLVEIAWHFPGGQQRLDRFPEPVAMLNLRGDAVLHQEQFRFLTNVASAVFVFAEQIGERESALLTLLKTSSAQCTFVLEGDDIKLKKFEASLREFLEPDKSQILPKHPTENETTFVENITSIVASIINSSKDRINVMSINEMADEARKLNIQVKVDEDSPECQNVLCWAKEIAEDIKDVAVYKKEELQLQGDLWKNLAKVEKELCRMERQGGKPSEQYTSELTAQWLELGKKQNACDLTAGLLKFLHALQGSNSSKRYFLKWMKFNLDHITREALSVLRAEYKKQEIFRNNNQEIANIDKSIASCSLGIEHFMRELSQFYEAEHSMLSSVERQVDSFPDIAAKLMLGGFPLELIDGDTSSIPLQWITGVLNKLNEKLKGRTRMMVITVLGSQSTGKSTLLNTMFGLRFAVSSGQCTRGAFMTLLKIRKKMARKLQCDLIVVIDTEGLKAPELAKLEDSCHHDNELATLVVGLSDITLVNLAMENATEMKDTLQIVTHAFLRMGNIGQKPNCQFVHQKCNDVSAHEQNMRNRKYFLDDLNAMTNAAAKMENVGKKIKFLHIVDYDLEKHNWYIPGLWHGDPPMAPVNIGYTEKIFELKKHLFEFIRTRSRPSRNIPQFIESMKNLWRGVKNENFIFSFRNSLIAEAYNALSVDYSRWDWEFRSMMYLWVSEQETLIQNADPDKLDHRILENELQQKLEDGKNNIFANLEKFFENGAVNAHLIEKYREDFLRSTYSLKEELEIYSSNKLRVATLSRMNKHKLDITVAKFIEVIEEKTDKLLDECRKNERQLESHELETEFGIIWEETLPEIQPNSFKKRDVRAEVESHLRKDLNSRGRLINENLKAEAGFLKSERHPFQMKDEYVHLSWYKHDCRKRPFFKAEKQASICRRACFSYRKEKVGSNGDYDDIYCVELLHMINEFLQNKKVKKPATTTSFEVDLKLHIMAEAAGAFQKMHENFITDNDPGVYLEKMRLQYFSTFKDLYFQKDAHQNRAKDFCHLYLQPVLADYVNKRLGLEIVNSLINGSRSTEYDSWTPFQYTLLKELLDKRDINMYIKYIKFYEEFVKGWIWKQLLARFAENGGLQELEKEILTAILEKIKETLRKSKDKSAQISEFVDSFCQEMQQELVIPKECLKWTTFNNISDPAEFSAHIETFLPDLQEKVLAEFRHLNLESRLWSLSINPLDEIFKQVFGCGNRCPFCKAPCEAGGSAHKQHFVRSHRPLGLGRYRKIQAGKLLCSLCSTNVCSNLTFMSKETEWKLRPYKDYREYYPDWFIQSDPSTEASDYWKFVFKEFNEDFAIYYDAKPADLPEDWRKITKEQALQALKTTYKMN